MNTPFAEHAPSDALLTSLREQIGAIPDPEIPIVSLADLGIFRSLEWCEDKLVVELTPTYSGCPATEAIRDDVAAALAANGYADAEVRIVLAPAWTTDWISDEAAVKLRAYGIVPPGQRRQASESSVIEFRPFHSQRDEPEVGPDACPQCGSDNLERLSEHGSTPCKALYRCKSCKEPFDYFKPY